MSLDTLVADATAQAEALGHTVTGNKCTERFGIVWRAECAHCGELLTATEQPLFGLPAIMGSALWGPCSNERS